MQNGENAGPEMHDRKTMDLFALKFDGLEIKEPNETFQDIYCAKLIVVVHAVRDSRELPQLLSAFVRQRSTLADKPAQRAASRQTVKFESSHVAITTIATPIYGVIRHPFPIT